MIPRLRAFRTAPAGKEHGGKGKKWGVPRFRAYRTAPAGREHGEKEKNEEHPGFGRVPWPRDDHAVAAVDAGLSR